MRVGTELAQSEARRRATVTGMDEARAVLERLERIERLDRGDAPAETLLAELRALVAATRPRPRREGASDEAVDALRQALERETSAAHAGMAT